MLGAIKHGKLLAWIKNIADASLLELVRMLPHGIAAIGRDDADADAFAFFARIDLVVVRIGHGTGMKTGDLVVGFVRHDGAQCGVAAVVHIDQTGVDAHFLKTIQIVPRIWAHSRHGQGIAAQKLEAIGGIARAAAVFFAHARHVKRHIELVNLIGQDLLGKVAAKTQDGVDGHRAANDGRHSKAWRS